MADKKITEFDHLIDWQGNRVEVGDVVVYNGSKGLSLGTIKRIYKRDHQKEIDLVNTQWNGKIYGDKYRSNRATIHGWDWVLKYGA